MAKAKKVVPKKGKVAEETGLRKGARWTDGSKALSMVTIAFARSPFSQKMRDLCAETGLSLATIVMDAVLTWETAVKKGLVPGQAAAAYKAESKATPAKAKKAKVSKR